MRAGLLGVSLSIAFGAISAEAGGAEHSLARLELRSAEGTESCMSKRELETAVERRLRRKVFREPAELLVEVRLARRGDAWTAELVLSDAQRRELGRRAFDTTAKDCSALDASLALVVALLVDSPPEPPEPPAETPAPAPVTTEKPRPRPTPIELPRDTFAPREPWRFVPTLSFSAAFERLPGFAFGPRAGVAFLPPHFSEFRVSVGGLLPREKTDESGEFGGRFWLVDALFELCPLEHATRAVRLSGCLGQSVGRLGVTGFGLDETEEEPALDMVVTAGVSAWLLVAGPFGVRLGLGAGFPLNRNSYFATAADGSRVEVWKRGFVVGNGEVGVGVEL
jgi:hypothetical protein